MWVFLPIGFYSVVQKKGDSYLTIRARFAGDLDRLKSAYLPGMGPVRLNEGTDYRYRASCTHAEWAEAMGKASMDINYDNFKNRAMPHLKGALHNVWGVIFQAAQVGRSPRW